LIQYRSVTASDPATQPPSHVAVAITLYAKASSLKTKTENPPDGMANYTDRARRRFLLYRMPAGSPWRTPVAIEGIGSPTRVLPARVSRMRQIHRSNYRNKRNGVSHEGPYWLPIWGRARRAGGRTVLIGLMSTLTQRNRQRSTGGSDRWTARCNCIHERAPGVFTAAAERWYWLHCNAGFKTNSRPTSWSTKNRAPLGHFYFCNLWYLVSISWY